MGAWGRRPQRVEGGALAFLSLLAPGLGDFLDAAEPVVQFAVGGFNHDVVDAGFGVGGEAGFQGVLVLAVPGGSQGDGEVGAGAGGARGGDRGFGFFGGLAGAVPAVVFEGSGEGGGWVAADPDGDGGREGAQAQALDVRLDEFGVGGDGVGCPDGFHDGRAFFDAAAALVEGGAGGLELGFHQEDSGAEDEAVVGEEGGGCAFLGGPGGGAGGRWSGDLVP